MRNVQGTNSDNRQEIAAGVVGSASDNIPAWWRGWYDERRAAVEAEISKHLNLLKSCDRPYSRLLEAVEYSLASGGKRLRPVLVLEACRLCGGGAAEALPAALALECIHTFSLIHDDLPAMDDDDLRRGRPTCHKIFGEGLAILAGDWLEAHAFELLSGEGAGPDKAGRLTQALACGSQAMIVGQGADIAGEQLETDAELVNFIHRHKTAALIETACRLGALSADAPGRKLEFLTEYGRRLGLAFQISDDLLDRTGAAENLGKRVGKDDNVSKQTYPAAFGMEASRERARIEIEAAVEALAPFDKEADGLRGLAWYVIARDR